MAENSSSVESRNQKLIDLLTSKNHSGACNAMKLLVDKSEHDDSVYAYMRHFFDLLCNESSYVRMRALFLIGANARYDSERIIDENIDALLSHINDDKPIAARKCIGILPEIARQKPKLKGRIIKAMKNADASIYNDSMRPLVENDIKKALEILNA